MSIVELTSHPFQRFDLAANPDWRGIAIDTADDAFFEDKTRALEVAFKQALDRGGLLGFIHIYIRVTSDLLRRSRNKSVMRSLLKDALFRLVNYYIFVRRRTRPYLAEGGSAYTWQIESHLLAKAQAAAAQQERDNETARDYDLDRDPELQAWVMKNVHPIVQGYVGSPVIKPWAHIRYADADRHGADWAPIYRGHPFAYFHLDEMLYSIPLIIYLNDVEETTGAFSYVEGSDKIKQNWVLRAFHQAVCHGQRIQTHDESDRKKIGSLPSVFRGGDLVGSFTGPEPFSHFNVVRVTGPAGTALISDGFQLVHAGGHPKVGTRNALFIAFRYPLKRIGDVVGRAVAAYWEWRVGQVSS